MGLAARKSVLEELGYKIATATNAPEAIECFIAGSFDLIVTAVPQAPDVWNRLLRSTRDLPFADVPGTSPLWRSLRRARLPTDAVNRSESQGVYGTRS